MSHHPDFETRPPFAPRSRRGSVVVYPRAEVFDEPTNLTPMWAGIACSVVDLTHIEIVISIHDTMYCTDFSSGNVPYIEGNPEATAREVEAHVLRSLENSSVEHSCKFIGAGVSTVICDLAENLCTRLWLDMDIIPIVLKINPFHTDSFSHRTRHKRPSPTRLEVSSSVVHSGAETPAVLIDKKHLQKIVGGGLSTEISPAELAEHLPIPRTVDEQAEDAACEAIMYFGPANNPRLTIGSKNKVNVDAGGQIHLVDDANEYKKTVGTGTWLALSKLVDELRGNGTKIGFFSSTPQGGGVALMRHALIRLTTLLDVDVSWYVPNPSPVVFRITKNNHNILQGVAAPGLRLEQEEKNILDTWIIKNGLRWTAKGGPLAPGGVDIAIIDDPQMPGLIPLIKKIRPDLPIIYRSHIEIRSDLVKIPGSPQRQVWEYLWKDIKLADMFISHPVNRFVPEDVPIETVALLGASTDWLDGLNKWLSPWNSRYYMAEFRSLCARERMSELGWPHREYIVQIARFDPAKGIPDVIQSYFKFRHLLRIKTPHLKEYQHPQLLICGHGAVDDPDASLIYDQTIRLISTPPYQEFSDDIVVMRLPPSDQLLNALLSNSKLVLQLSTREGFEVKVSEALHAGKPVVASRTGGIPLQIEEGQSGYTVTPGDNDAVAQHLFNLYTDKDLYDTISAYARTHVSDEVGTVGSAAVWLYLAVMFARGERLKPNGAWLSDLMREETGEYWLPGEPRLPREKVDIQGTGHTQPQQDVTA